MGNPEAWLWLAVVLFGVIYIANMVAHEVTDWRERKRVRRIMKETANG